MPHPQPKPRAWHLMLYLCGAASVLVPFTVLGAGFFLGAPQQQLILLVCTPVMVGIGGYILWFATRLARLQHAVQKATQAYRRGPGGYRFPDEHSLLTGSLYHSLADMVDSIERQAQRLLEERDSGRTILDAMDEGVLAINHARKVILMNPAAGQLLRVDPQAALGKEVGVALRNADLQRLLQLCQGRDATVEHDVYVKARHEVLLKARATPLVPAHSKRAGILIVMRDVTRIRLLEKMRQDFVANVSHELKTPITSIKGFVETLVDLDQQEESTRQRFLAIIARQAEHLNAIVTDLLLLSSLENDADKGGIPLQTCLLTDIVEAAVELVQQRAQSKQVRLEVAVADQFVFPMRPHLLEQAIVNLLDNAIKCSPDQSSVCIRAYQQKRNIVIEIQDNGPGIERRHLERLFERFYRVDRGRNKTQGGTGLGLAIVKHIVALHGGTVQAESSIGCGSTFRMDLPMPPAGDAGDGQEDV